MGLSMVLMLNVNSEDVSVKENGCYQKFQICDYCRSEICLKHIKLPNSFYVCAPVFELPSNISSMVTRRHIWIRASTKLGKPKKI